MSTTCALKKSLMLLLRFVAVAVVVAVAVAGACAADNDVVAIRLLLAAAAAEVGATGASAGAREVTLACPVRSYSSRLRVVDGGLLKLYGESLLRCRSLNNVLRNQCLTTCKSIH